MNDTITKEQDAQEQMIALLAYACNQAFTLLQEDMQSDDEPSADVVQVFNVLRDALIQSGYRTWIGDEVQQ